MTQTKKQQQQKARANEALYKESPFLWAIKQGIGEGSIIWAIHPGCLDGQFMDLKAHPFLILGWRGEEALLLPLSESKAKGNRPFFGQAMAPDPRMAISAPAWDCILKAAPQMNWKATADQTSDLANRKAKKAYTEQRIAEFAEAEAKGIAKIWLANPITPSRLQALKAEARQQGRINRKGAPIHATPGCKALA